MGVTREATARVGLPIDQTADRLLDAAARIGFRLAAEYSEFPSFLVFTQGVRFSSWPASITVDLQQEGEDATNLNIVTHEEFTYSDLGRGQRRVIGLLEPMGGSTTINWTGGPPPNPSLDWMSRYFSGDVIPSYVSTDRRLGSSRLPTFAAVSWTISLGAAIALVFTVHLWLFLPMIAAVGLALFFTVKAFDRRTTHVPPSRLVTLAMWSFLGALVLIALFIVIYKFEFGGLWLLPVNLVIGFAGYGMVIVGVVYLARSTVASSRERRFRRVSAESPPFSASKISVVSLVLGLIGFPCGAVLVSPIATYLGLVGIRRAQREHRATDGLAVIGFSLGLLGSVAAVTTVVVYVLASYEGGT